MKAMKASQNSKAQDSKPWSLKDYNKPTLRILGGIYKGRKLQMASLETTRSSKAILKESFFNTLNQSIAGASFVEFFAGSGNVGIEAISRGARFVMFFEKDKAACEVLRFNLQSICQKRENYRVIFGDTFCYYSLACKDLQSPCIGYIDPPFCLRKNMQDIYEKCYQMVANLDKSCFDLIVLEHISSLVIPTNIGSFTLIKSRKFGKSSLSYFG